MLDVQPHNFGRYYGDIITDTAAFAGFWSNVASEFKSNSLVIFDTNNEFHDEPGQLVADLNQAAIDAIRSAGATSQYIAVEGNAYTGAWTWTTATGTDGLTNAETMGSLTDPSDKILYEVRAAICCLHAVPFVHLLTSSRCTSIWTAMAQGPRPLVSAQPSVQSVLKRLPTGFVRTARRV